MIHISNECTEMQDISLIILEFVDHIILLACQFHSSNKPHDIVFALLLAT